MKKRILLLLVFGFTALTPQKLTSSVFSLKSSLGISLLGKISDRWTTTSDFFSQKTEKEASDFASVNLFFELGVSISRNLCLFAGAGYFSKGLNGSKAIFTLPASGDLTGDFTVSPQFHFKSYPVLLTAQWTFPVTLGISLYILGGVGYYVSRFNSTNKHIYYNLQPQGSTLNYFPVDFRGSSNSFGYHAGAGIEAEIDWKIFFFIESLYRRANFERLKKEFAVSEESPAYELIMGRLGDSAEESTFLYYHNWGGNEEWGDISYLINGILLSEIVINMGLRVKF